jgi:beta-lactam-binding protein with PASTA domain
MASPMNPNISNKPADQAATTLRELGLDAAFVDNGGTAVATPENREVKAQSPTASSIVKLASVVTLTV